MERIGKFCELQCRQFRARHIVRDFNVNDSFSLQITSLPYSVSGASATVVPTYFDAFTTNNPPKVEAYLSAHKID